MDRENGQPVDDNVERLKKENDDLRLVNQTLTDRVSMLELEIRELRNPEAQTLRYEIVDYNHNVHDECDSRRIIVRTTEGTMLECHWVTKGELGVGQLGVSVTMPWWPTQE